jgi:hypothetical protein
VAAANTALHDFHDPLISGEVKAPPISIKLPVCQGNLQISIRGIQAGDKMEYIADIDIDEHFSTLLHLLDVGKHHVTKRGTNSLDMGEMLQAQHRAAGGPPLELGYRLVPMSVPQSPCNIAGRKPRTRR